MAFIEDIKKVLPAFIIIGLYVIVAEIVFGHVSPTMVLFGLPCPACGMTRAGLLFFGGNFADSFAMHPLFLPGFVFILCAMAFKFFKREWISKLTVPGIVLIVVFLAFYVYRMVYFFPDQVPMVVNESSVWHRVAGMLK